jgi:hypothetical protein
MTVRRDLAGSDAALALLGGYVVIRGFLANPAQFLFEGLILRFKPVNMDVLPLYIVLMGVFPPVRARATPVKTA